MPLTGLNEATGAVEAVLSVARRDARNAAREALKAARPLWEAPIREIHRESKGAPGPKVCEECFRVWPCPTFRTLSAFSDQPPKPEPPAGYAGWWHAMMREYQEPVAESVE